MSVTKKILAGLVVSLCVSSLAQAQLVSVDFNTTAASDPVNSTTLNATTSGGTWTVNSLEESIYLESTITPGNMALQTDRGSYDFDLDFTSAAALSGTTVSWNWQLVRKVSGNADGNRRNNMSLFDSTGDELLNVYIANTTSGSGGLGVFVSGTGLVASGLSKGNADTYVEADMHDFELVLGASGFDVWLNGSKLNATTIAYNAVVTDLDTIQLWGSGNDAGGQIDNLVIAVPEPGTSAMLAGLLGLSYVLLRRRQ